VGWCSATDIMDTAIQAADEATLTTIRQVLDVFETTVLVEINTDKVLRPFVRRIAEALRAGDWDCIEESDYYDRFGPEMRGMTDQEFRRHQAEVYRDDPERFASWLVDVWAPQERGDV
jgi:hypothetical protein